ncbi:TFIIS helical bundle-like domain containing protein [Leishmania donovani]|uniref:TFIIS_helical_bundle-like_domain_containing_protein_-_putative n=3 Tax=Leishmania donovani species complex TaxID=38574 RepID=A0A6L0XDG5_LEIIN|nr:conserved hypothetical protein [Leishmania infantum JPCM5]CAC9487754.1 TFIIS_helical_bundle-like_domain_containing_protein_-_putative [Leishmania infantum]CAJ1988748.1 TFIIS helical bundle-like domain containing protein [Leishmania donovani]CAM67992.2 conserved hypothetical protein [Leishmania infantum JPCM5]SUZ41745.1 TFIIS_helical_bundle-like_domain_containing_protein_-_putative [Leishmania infantum]VDZ44628.1 TFIIS_helical_bundle-like_domain_containing_protein_putative/Pfam:PF08711 [Leis|eukprot:XP_001465569.2 conserved hypothetical protein [Leishmania infantum JPCM5]
MEEEDSILGLVPASLPVHADSEDSVVASGYVGGGPGSPAAAGADTDDGSSWTFEHVLRATIADAEENDNNDAEAGRSGGDEEDDGSDVADNDEEQVEDAVDFRDGGAPSGAEGHGGASAGAAEGGHADDVMLLSIGDKKAAKRLGKRLYKRWKKLHKASQSKKDRHKSSKKAGSQKSKGKEKAFKHKKASGSRKKTGTKARRDDHDDDGGEGSMFLSMADGADDVDGELGLVPAADLSDAAAAIEARLKKAALRESKMRTEKAVKKAAQRKTSSAELAAIAKELVAAMAKARQLDEDIISGRNTFPGAFPLNRVALKSIVQARCRQGYIVGPLVEAGILQELSYWLYDVDRADPAPYELRTAALDILVSLPMEGSIAATEDLTAFMGVSREHLIKTDLGRALNALRRYNEETIDNKGKCVQLLTTFSRVISGASDKDQMDEHKSKAVWKCQRDPTVASPFEVLETCSEAFQKSFMKPDPRDPTSYNGVLPWRPPAATITNVSGKLGDYIEKANINPRR